MKQKLHSLLLLAGFLFMFGFLSVTGAKDVQAAVSLGAMVHGEVVGFPVSVPTCTDVTLTASAPGARKIVIYVEDETGARLVEGSNESLQGTDSHSITFCLVTAHSCTAYAVAYYEDDTEEESKKEGLDVTARGTLPEPQILSINTVGRYVAATWSAEGATNGHISFIDADGNSYGRNQSFDGTAFMGVVLPKEGTYTVDIKANATGMNQSQLKTTYDFHYSMNKSGLLQVNGQTAEKMVIPANATYKVEADIPAATAIRIWNGDNWRYYQGSHGEFTCSHQGGRRVFIAQASYDEVLSDLSQMAYEAETNAVDVSIEWQGVLPNPEFHFEEDSVERGDYLVVDIENVTREDEWFTADIIDANGNYLGGYTWDEKLGKINVPTIHLSAGSYILKVDSVAPGIGRGITRKTFTVTESEDLGAVLMQVPESVYVGEPMPIVVYAEGASKIRVENRRKGDPNWSNIWGWDGETHSTTRTYTKSGTYVLTPAAQFENGEIIEGSPVEVEVISEGTLENPQFSIPVTLAMGKDLQGSIYPVEGAEEYEVNLHYEGKRLSTQRLQADHPSFTFLSDLFTEPGEYVISVHAYGTHKDEGYQSLTVMVSDEIREDVVLSANGQTDQVTVMNLEGFSISVKAPGATAVWICRDAWHDEYYKMEDLQDRQLWYNGSGLFNMYVRVSYDDLETVYDDEDEEYILENLNYTAISNGIQVNVIAPYGQAPDPTVSLGSASVPRGEYLVVDIERGHPDSEYFADLIRGYGTEDEEYLDEWYEYDTYATENTGKILIPTAGLEPGAYTIGIGEESQGWNGCELYFDFSVTPPEQEKNINLYASDDTVMILDHFNLSVWAEGAERIGFRVTKKGDDWEDWRERDGESSDWGWEFWSSGTYIFTPYAYYPNSEEAVDGDSITVVAESLGVCDPAVIHIPAVIGLGEDLNGSFEAVEHVDYYQLYLHYLPPHGDWVELACLELAADQTNFTFPADLFTVAGTYRVETEVFPEDGYEGNEIGNRFVVSESNPDVVLTVNGSTEADQVVWSNENLHVAVSAPGATLIRVYRDWWDYWEDDGDFGSRNWTFSPNGDVELFSLVAEATYDSLDGAYDEDGEIDETKLHWTASNGIRLEVRSNGKLDVPVVSVQDEVVRGEYLHVHVDEVEYAEEYKININTYVDDEEWGGDTDEADWCFGEAYPYAGDFILPTANLVPEEDRMFFVEVVAYGTGYTNNYTLPIYFTVREPDSEEASFQVDKTEVLTNDNYSISIFAPGAQSVRLCNYEFDNCWEERGEDHLIINRRDQWEDKYLFRAYATYDGEEWEEIGDSIEVHVTAPNGSLDAPDVNIPEVLSANEPLHGSINAVNRATYYYMDLHYVGEEWEWLWSEDLASSDLHFDIPARYLTRAGKYRIWVDAGCDELGVEKGGTEYWFYVGEQFKDVTFIATPEERLLGEEVEYQIIVNEVPEKIRFLVNGVVQSEYDNTGSSLEARWQTWDAGDYELKAGALIAGSWKYSDPVMVHYEKLGALESPQGTFPSYILFGQEDLVFTFETSEDVEWYDITVYDAEDGRKIADCDLDGPGTYTNNDIEFFDGEYLEPGHIYEAKLSLYQEGFEPGWSPVYRFAVVEPTAVLYLPENLREIQEEALQGTYAYLIYVPDGTTTIGPRAFADSANLVAVSVPAGASIADTAFEGCYPEVVVERR